MGKIEPDYSWEEDRIESSLFIDKKWQATIYHYKNQADLAGVDGNPAQTIISPQTNALFDVVSEYFEKPSSDIYRCSKRLKEDPRVKTFGKHVHPKIGLPGYDLETARDELEIAGSWDLRTKKGDEASFHLAEASLLYSNGRYTWTREVETHLEAAIESLTDSDELEFERASDLYAALFHKGYALRYCVRALTCGSKEMAESKKHELSEDNPDRHARRKWNGGGRNGRGW
jgi:hypothetical protein